MYNPANVPSNRGFATVTIHLIIPFVRLFFHMHPFACWFVHLFAHLFVCSLLASFYHSNILSLGSVIYDFLQQPLFVIHCFMPYFLSTIHCSLFVSFLPFASFLHSFEPSLTCFRYHSYVPNQSSFSHSFLLSFIVLTVLLPQLLSVIPSVFI